MRYTLYRYNIVSRYYGRRTRLGQSGVVACCIIGYYLFILKGEKLKLWYDLNKTLTYNCLFNIVIGNRGCGKTYASKKRAIKQFLEKGHQFVYLRRYETELDEVKESLFNDIMLNGEFKGHTITYRNGYYFIDDKLFGYCMALTKAHYYKSASFPLVNLIIFDECIIDNSGSSHYLKHEVRKFLDLYETIARMRDGVIVFFLSNAISIINPYTLFWNLSLPYNSNITRKKEVLLQLVQDADFIEQKKNTRFGKLISGTEYANYSIENKFLLDNDNFLQKKSDKATYYFTFKYNGDLYGVWVDYSIGKFFVSKSVDPFFKMIYCVTLDDHTPNTLLIKSSNKSIYFKTFIDNYKDGNVFFESLKVKSVVYNVIKLCIGGI